MKTRSVKQKIPPAAKQKTGGLVLTPILLGVDEFSFLEVHPRTSRSGLAGFIEPVLAYQGVRDEAERIRVAYSTAPNRVCGFDHLRRDLGGDGPDRQRLVREWSPPQGYCGSIEAISFSRNGRWLRLAGRDGALGYWDLKSDPGELRSRRTRGYAYWPSFAANGRALAVATTDDRVVVEDPVSTRPILVLTRLPKNLSSLALSNDGRTLATSAGNGEIELWDVKSGRELVEGRVTGGRINCSVFSPDGKILAAGRSDGVLVFWNTADASIKTLVQADTSSVSNGLVMSSFSSLAFSADGKALASVQHDSSEVAIWDVATGRRLATLHGTSHSVKSVVFSPHGGLIASARLLMERSSSGTRTAFRRSPSSTATPLRFPHCRSLRTARGLLPATSIRS